MARNALIFSPGFDGHRQVYVFVIAHILKELDFNIYIAGNTKQKISNSFYIDKLNENPEINFIDTSKYAEGGLDITIQEFLELQNNLKTELTIFPEADHHLKLLASQISSKKNRLRGRTTGIFMRPFYFYRQSAGVLDKLRFLKHFRSRVKKDENVFYDFFLKRFHLLDTSLCIDENFVTHHPYLKWLPDVFQQYAESIVKDEKSEDRIWIEKLDKFKENNKDKFHFLYFGTSQYRRGYDILLNLAQKTGGCFIHCGLIDNKVQYDYDIHNLRASLSKDGHLFETNQYLADPLCIEHFFKSVSHLVLPYRQYYGSSGVMLQALDLGIPVLSPDSGIIGYRIKNHNLGLTYKDDGFSSLETQFDLFKNIDPLSFKKSVNTYMDFQTIEQLKSVLINSFSGSHNTVLQPVLQKA
ncbi:MAG: hypothetical protein ABI237_17215 [Ginsengibacter sp.]